MDNDHGTGMINSAFSLPSGPANDVIHNQRIKSDEIKHEDFQKGRKQAYLSGLQYKVDDNPPWITTILLGFQHYLLLLGSNLATPSIMATIMCAKEDLEVHSILLGNMLFACGLCTFIQTYIGVRLPIVQCPAFAYVVPLLAMTSFESWSCPDAGNSTMKSINQLINGTENNTNTLADNGEPYWHTRLNMVSGTLMVAAVFEIFLGASGMISILLRFIGPLTVAPTIMMMGLGVVQTGFEMAGKHWGIAFGTMCLIMILSEVIPTFYVKPPCLRSTTEDKSKADDRGMEIVFHKMFSVIISVCVMWLMCYILTIAGAFPQEKGQYGFEGRTDIRTHVIDRAPWATFPYPGKFGKPTFSSAIFVAMIAGVITSVIESIGDYYTCARIAGALPPPSSAVNRGILIEGIDCILAVLVGSGFGVTSCSQNIGVISLTKVGSRRVVLVAAVLMMLFGCFSKMSAFVVTIPDPIIGASFIVLFGVLAAVGASNLQYVDLNSSRNMIVFGMGLFCGLAAPMWIKANESLLSSVDPVGIQVVTALLGNSMFIACFTSLILDNLLPGTPEERGIISWRKTESEDSTTSSFGELTLLKTYDFPFGMKYINKWKWTKYIPFFPNFMEIENICKCVRPSQKSFNKGIDLDITITPNEELESGPNKHDSSAGVRL